MPRDYSNPIGHLYTLDDHNRPVDCPDVLEWGAWMNGGPNGDRRRVELTELSGGIRVSTVFLGVNHNFYGDGPPILWETMTFGNGHMSIDEGDFSRRYSSALAARTGHWEIVEAVTQWLARAS